ncbi:hypothetical protein [Microbacterium sp.]|uniref:hypothetical protein n=1 Tax=Microbacterium sp. TaxID=51671 RepID=UPI003A9474C4
MGDDETDSVKIARVDERVRAIERDIRDIKTSLAAQTTNRPQWPAVLAAAAAVGALVVTLAMNL